MRSNESSLNDWSASGELPSCLNTILCRDGRGRKMDRSAGSGQVRPKLLIFASTILVGAALLGTIVAGRDRLKSTNETTDADLRVANQSQEPTWFLTDEQAAARSPAPAPAAPDMANIEPVPVAETVPDGPGSCALQDLVGAIVPQGSRVVQSVDVAVGASIVSYQLPGGTRLNISRQKLTEPIPMSMLTQGSPTSTYSRFDSGTETIVSTRATAASVTLSVSVVIARPNGTVLIVSETTDSLTGDNSFAYGAEALATKIEANLDSERLDL